MTAEEFKEFMEDSDYTTYVVANETLYSIRAIEGYIAIDDDSSIQVESNEIDYVVEDSNLESVLDITISPLYGYGEETYERKL